MNLRIAHTLKLQQVVASLFLALLFITYFSQIQTYDSHKLVSGLTLILFLRALQLVERRAREKIVLTFTSAIILSFCLPLNNFQRWMLFLILTLTFLAWKSEVQTIRQKLKALINPTMVYLIFINFFAVLKHFGDYVLQFSTFGYDNALHFSLYKAYRITNWFPFVHPNKWSSNFDLFHNYPSGQSALFSFLSDLIIGASSNPIDNLEAYFLILVTVLISIWYLSSRLMIGTHSNKNSYLTILSGLAITIAFAGIFLTNGFPPYLFGLLLVLLWTQYISKELNKMHHILIIGIFVPTLILVSPLLIFCIFFPVVALTVNELKAMVSLRRTVALIGTVFYLLTCAISTLLINGQTSSKFGWRQILTGGGIQPPNVAESILLMTLIVFVGVLKWRRFLDPLYLVLLSTFFSFVVISFLTIYFTGIIQYYAIKQFYVLLLISAIVVFQYSVSEAKVNWKTYSTLTLITSILIIATFFSKSYASGFMGTLPRALRADLQTSTWNQNVVNSNLQTKAISLIPPERKNDCVIYRVAQFDSDLNSRWANALLSEQSTSSSCFNAYWNSNSISDEELLAKLENFQSSFTLVVSDKSNLINIPSNVFIVRV